MSRVLFVMEQHLGHRSFYLNLKRIFNQSSRIRTTWIEVTYYSPRFYFHQFPGLIKKLIGTLIGKLTVINGLVCTSYDAALFNTQVPAVLGLEILKLRRKPFIICTDITPMQYDLMSIYYGHRPDNKSLLSLLKFKANQETFRAARFVLPWSNWTRSSLINDYGVNPNQIEVIPPGVNLDLWYPGHRKSTKQCRILFVGGDFHRKGGDILVNAFRKLPLGLAELVIVTKTEIPEVQGISVFRDIEPNSKELVDLYRSSDIFVLPTRAEAFGISAIEASAAGLPVIATPIGGLSDIVLDGKTGFLIQPEDEQSLINRLNLLIINSDLRNQMGEASRRHAVGNFDAITNGERIEDILLEIAK